MPTYHHYRGVKPAAVRYITGTTDSSDESIDRNASAKLIQIFGKDEAANDNFAEVKYIIISSMSNVYRDIYPNQKLLMTDELISEGNDVLMTTRKNIIELAKDASKDKFILELIGRYLMTLQMFYCNTNWIELDQQGVCENLGVTNAFPKDLSRVDEATCIYCNDKKDGDCNQNLITKTLTSGYLSYGQNATGGNKPYNIKWENTGKCSHGGNLDQSREVPAKGGINKETPEMSLSPHYLLHEISDHGLLSEIGNQSFERIFRINRYQTLVAQNETAYLVNTTDALLTNNSLKPYQTPNIAEKMAAPVCYNCFQSTLSLVFVIDDTSSMSNDIFQVRKEAISIVSKATSSQSSLANYILVTFNDPAYYNTIFMTSNGNEMIDRLNKLSVYGGGDCPEYAFTGIRSGIMAAHNGSCVFLFTDADPKDYDLCEEVVALIEMKNIHLVAFLTGQCTGNLTAGESSDCIHTKLQPLSCTRLRKRAANGLSSGMFSGLGGTVISAPDREITAPLKTLLEKNMDIRYVYIAQCESDNEELQFPVDDYLAVLTIEIIGPHNKADIVLLKPNGLAKSFTNSDTLEFVGRNTFIASVMEPEPGTWTLSNSRRQHWTVHVKGQGDVDIKLNLMERISSSLLDITGKPVSGHNITVVATVNGINASSEINFMVLYSETRTEIQRRPVTVYMDFGNIIAVAELRVPSQNFWLVIEGQENNNTFQRTTESVIKPSVADLKILDNIDELYPGIISNLTCLITNFGSNDDTFLIKAIDDKSFLLNPKQEQILIGSGKSERISFQLKGGRPKSITTLTLSVRHVNEQVIQEQELKLMVAEFIPPSLHNISIGSMCSATSLNFQNCSKESIEVTLDIKSVSELKLIYCKPETVEVAVANGSAMGIHSVVISSDCCIPVFRLFVKDFNNLTVEKNFDFTDGFIFSTYLPKIEQSQPKPNTKETSLNKSLVYGCIGGGIAFFVSVVIMTSICFSKRRKSLASEDNIHMK